MSRKALMVCAAFLAVGAAVSFTLLLTRQATPTLAPQNVRSTGAFTIQATPGTAKIGQTINLTVTAKGPLTYNSCRPVDYWVTDGSGRTVWRLVQFWMCPNLGTLTLAAGHSTSFTDEWRTSAVAPGTYSVHAGFDPGNGAPRQVLPVVTVVLD